MPRLIRAALERSGVQDPGRASSGVDVVGDIAIVRLEGFTQAEKRKIGRSLLGEMKNVRVVLEQEGGIEGEFRLRKVKHLAGERRTLTVHRENGCSFRVDVARTYFSPRLSTERLRVAEAVGQKERVLNMFAGVGPFSILIAKRAHAGVTSCEINGYAAELHEENNRLNKVADLVTVVNADASDLPRLVKTRFDRILLPHPSAADKFLPAALKLAKKGARLVYYRHVLGADEAEAARALRRELRALLPVGSRSSLRRVREVGPRWVEMAAEIRLPA
ncbi:MAG TPA: class I SAM-dependent methyltransferase family protein [Nitrososphaerales archaeon]|nr:class I SAM-dependent methyltransferase family protein [Nitrososphaerales archaeon]